MSTAHNKNGPTDSMSSALLNKGVVVAGEKFWKEGHPCPWGNYVMVFDQQLKLFFQEEAKRGAGRKRAEGLFARERTVEAFKALVETTVRTPELLDDKVGALIPGARLVRNYTPFDERVSRVRGHRGH